MILRTKYLKDIGWFAQVKKHFFSGWKTIGKHPSGFGLYPKDHTEYPLETQHQAEERCRLFEQWYYEQRNRTANYHYL